MSDALKTEDPFEDGVFNSHVEHKPIKVVIFGSGSYGTALATVAARRGHEVVMTTRREELVESVNKEHKNCTRLQDFELLPNITATTDMAAALEGAGMIIHAVPAQNTFDYISTYAHLIPEDVPIVSTSKGIYTETLELMSDVFPRALKRTNQPLAFLSGPSFAKEIMLAHPILVTCASTDEKVASFVAETLSTQIFRIYMTDDVIGVEVGGALKNPLAIVSGLLQGLGYGASTSAALVTRGCSEMKKLAVAMGGRAETLAGLSGVGDLVLTANSKQSRNFTVGFRLAQGESLEAITESMGEVAEGVPTASVAEELMKKYNLNLPIFSTAQKVITGEISHKEAIKLTLDRPLRNED